MLRTTLYYPRTLKQSVRGSLRVFPLFKFLKAISLLSMALCFFRQTMYALAKDMASAQQTFQWKIVWRSSRDAAWAEGELVVDINCV
jgi:hypothetical protein